MKKHTKNNTQKNSMTKNNRKTIITIKIIRAIKTRSITTTTLLKIINIMKNPIMIRNKVSILIVHINKNTNFTHKTTTTITEMGIIVTIIKISMTIKTTTIEININTKITIYIKMDTIKRIKIMNM